MPNSVEKKAPNNLENDTDCNFPNSPPKKDGYRRMYIGDLLGLAEGLGKCGFFFDPHA